MGSPGTTSNQQKSMAHFGRGLMCFETGTGLMPMRHQTNYRVTFFCLKMPKIWVGRMMLNREKKRMALE